MNLSRMQTLAMELEVISVSIIAKYIYLPNMEKHYNGSSIRHMKLTMACIKMKAFIQLTSTNILKQINKMSIRVIQCSYSASVH